jgi:hypothetical protein
MTVFQLLERANPLLEGELRLVVPQEWSDATLRAIVADAPVATRRRAGRRRRLLAATAIVLAGLAVPAYAIGRAVEGWLGGEPAPTSAVRNFGSYTPQLGFKPAAGKAVVVASDGGFDLFATTNDRGTYCVATSTPDGGICVRPSVAAAPIAAGIMPGDPGRRDARGTLLVAGRVGDSRAVAVSFADPDGKTVTRQLGHGGFFLAALPTGATDWPPYACKNGSWETTFRAVGASGEELVTAPIALAWARSTAPRTCGWANGPHT